MTSDQSYHATDAESQANLDEYQKLVKALERRMDRKSNTVLVVDDSKVVRMTVSKGIQGLDESVIIFEAENGQEAIEALSHIRLKYNSDPLLIVSDLEMPVMDGWQLIEHLYKEYRSHGQAQGIPLIVLSASSGEKGMLFKKSVFAGKCPYEPMITVAKKDCVKPGKYDTKEGKGLLGWIRHFMRVSAE